MEKLLSRFRRRGRSDKNPIDELLGDAKFFVIVIDGWSKKARFVERHTDLEEASRRRDAIDADATLDTAFIVETTEETLRVGTDTLCRMHLKAKALGTEVDPPPSAA
jgi:hypothetical protein